MPKSRIARAATRAAALAAGLAIAGLASVGAASADGSPYVLIIKDHVFTPAVIEVPAGQEFEIVIRNQDDTPEEFDSGDLDREKMIPAGAEVTVRVDPLEPGSYSFMGEYHYETAQGEVVAK